MAALTFNYRALDRDGAARTGLAEAASEGELYGQLVSAGLTPVWIRESRGRSGVRGERARRGARRASAKQVADFTYQFAVLVDARIPLSEGLRSIAEQEPDAGMSAVILDLAKRIQSGEPLAKAMGAHPGVFSGIYVQTVQAAEATGNLVKAMEHLSETLEREDEARRQVRTALTYPALVVTVLVLGVAFLIGYVVPKFAKIFSSRGVELPVLTRVLVAIGEFAQQYWYACIGGVIALAFGVRAMLRSERGRAAIEDGLHRVPLMRRLMVGLAVARFSRVLGLCVSSGLNLLDSLNLAARASGRAALIRDLGLTIDEVRRGARLSVGLQKAGYLPPFARRMIAAGEESGQIPGMCALVARQYERESAHLVKALATVIEPVMVVAVAGIVLVVALAIFLPMWEMVNVIS